MSTQSKFQRFTDWLNNVKSTVATTGAVGAAGTATTAVSISGAAGGGSGGSGVISSTTQNNACMHGMPGGYGCSQCAGPNNYITTAPTPYTITVPGTYTVQSPTWITLPSSGGTGGGYVTTTSAIYHQPLTDQEKQELEALEEEHKIATKAIKITKFRELHPEMRQMIIALLVWQEQRDDISKSEADKPTRLQELQSKKNNNGYGHITMSYGSTVNMTWPVVAPPDGLTKEDLIEAHTLATIEEELLKDETDS